MPHRVLVVGADSTRLLQVESALRRAGQPAVAQEDAARAAVLARQFLPTVLLLVDDPVSRAARETLSLLIAHPATSSLPKVALDADVPLDVAVDLLSGGIVDLPPLPRSGGELAARLDRVLGSRERDRRRQMAYHRRGPVALRRIGEVVRRKKGCGTLVIEGAGAPAQLRFDEGRLEDAELGHTRGPPALEALLKIPTEAPWGFSFTSLDRDGLRSLEQSSEQSQEELLIEVVDEAELASLPALSEQPATTRALKLLLCDDDDALLLLYRRFFERVGYETVVATDGARGFATALTEKPDVIVSDIMMPETDGWGFLTYVRNDHRVRETPFLLLSCHGDYLSRLKDLAAGADDYLEKGLRAEAVLERVANVVAPRRQLLASVATAGPGFNGRLSRIGAQYLLRALVGQRRSGTLVVDDGHTAYEVGIEGTRIVGAVARRGEHVITGRDALLSLLAVDDAPLTFVAGPSGEDRSIDAEGAPLLDALGLELNQARDATDERLLAANAQLTFDDALLQFYALASTTVVRPLLMALRGGAAPRELLERGEASPLLLEWVVKDLLRKRIARFESAALPGSAALA